MSPIFKLKIFQFNLKKYIRQNIYNTKPINICAVQISQKKYFSLDQHGLKVNWSIIEGL